MKTPQGFLDALVSAGRSPELADADDIFGFLIGSWEIGQSFTTQSGQTQRSKGEIHASSVLEGRTIQDLFIFPRRADRASGVPPLGDRYATTIRTYDRALEAWRVNFINPAADETSAQLLARRNGHEIIMEGTLSCGTPIRWRYPSITPTSFHYSAEKLGTDGKSWQLYLELFGKRMNEAWTGGHCSSR